MGLTHLAMHNIYIAGLFNHSPTAYVFIILQAHLLM